MKKTSTHFIRSNFLLATFFALQITASGQGRVVVNEFMAWPSCNTTNEFIELLNFGPGPMNIGCYIVTNGTYAVTIPPNTILKPGQYFVISGENVISKDCANQDSAIKVDLNWNTCNCADRLVPTTGDGFMKDGGSANEKVILFDPAFKVVDAVSRNATPSTSIPITTSVVSGSCTSRTFDLDTMSINYEIIGNSTGINNSYARRVDGDCGWVKTPAISAHAPNKTGSSSSASYSFTAVSAAQCTGTAGFVSIGVNAANVSSLFPMTYILAYDADSNGVFDETDQYTQGIDASPASIDINNLNYGRYRITVGSSLGCNLQSFDFFIFNCYGIILPLHLSEFKYHGVNDGRHLFKCVVTERESIQAIVLEASDGGAFETVTTIENPASNNLFITAPVTNRTRFRLGIISKNGTVSYSSVVETGSAALPVSKLWPNPVTDQFFVQLPATNFGKIDFTIVNAIGTLVKRGSIDARPGTNIHAFNTDDLPPGVYMFRTSGNSITRAVTLRFIKK